MLSSQSLTKRYGAETVVDTLTLHVADGEIYGLLGPNGAGKSTTIQIFLGFVTPDSGSRMVAGIDVGSDPAKARGQIGYVPETVALYPWLTGRENLQFFARLAGHTLGRAASSALLARVGVATEAANRRVAEYSKGMRQKVGIAIALAKKARVLFLDEPSSGLDPEAANELSALLREVAGDKVTVLMATHDLFRASEVCDRVGIMRHGRLMMETDVAALTPQALDALYLQHIRSDR